MDAVLLSFSLLVDLTDRRMRIDPRARSQLCAPTKIGTVFNRDSLNDARVKPSRRDPFDIVISPDRLQSAGSATEYFTLFFISRHYFYHLWVLQNLVATELQCAAELSVQADHNDHHSF